MSYLTSKINFWAIETLTTALTTVFELSVMTIPLPLI